LVGEVVTVLEIQIHPPEGSPHGLTIAAGRAMDQAVALAGRDTV